MKSTNLKAVMESIDGNNLTPTIDLEKIEIEGGYVSDLLSDVMGNAKPKQAWITIMRHLNVIAVASLAGLPAIIFGKGLVPEQAVIEKALEEDICLISSQLSIFEISGKLYKSLND